jgi:uncharacterized protein (AIM24 family)
MAVFRAQGSRVLAVDLSGDALKAKAGAMVAYDGTMAFKRLSGGGEGLRGLVTRRITGESMTVKPCRVPLRPMGVGTLRYFVRTNQINQIG